MIGARAGKFVGVGNGVGNDAAFAVFVAGVFVAVDTRD